MKIRIALVASLFLLAFLPTAEAQEETETTIYLHGMDASWAGTPMSLSFNPPTGTESGTTCTGCAGPGAWTNSGSWTVPVDLTMGAGTARATGYVKSWNNGPAPQTTLAYSVKVDGSEIAVGSGTADVLAGAIVKFDFDLTFTEGDILAGSEMVLDIQLYDETTGGYNPAAYPKEGPAYPWSFTLPVIKPLPPAPAPVLEPQMTDVDAASLDLEYAYPEAATQVWTYNWTNFHPTGNITTLADVEEGSVHFFMTDDLNDTLLDVTLEATFEQNQTFEGFEGNWTIIVSFTNFKGNASLEIMPDLPLVVNPLTGMEGEPDEGETFEDGNAPAETKDSPGVAVLLPLLGLAFVALRRRS